MLCRVTQNVIEIKNLILSDIDFTVMLFVSEQCVNLKERFTEIWPEGIVSVGIWH